VTSKHWFSVGSRCVCVCVCFQIYDIAKATIIHLAFKKIMKRKFLNNFINFWLPWTMYRNLANFLNWFWEVFFKTSLRFWHKNSIFFNSVKHLPIVVNAVGTRVLLQLFSLQSGLCPNFFHLGISRHVLGILEVLGGHVTCYKTLGTCYPACYLSFGTHNMQGYGCKTWQGEKKTGQM